MQTAESLPDWMAGIDLEGYEMAGHIPLLPNAAHCLKYSRARAYDYDTIAFVFGASHRHAGPVPFATVPRARMEHAVAVEREHNGTAAASNDHRLLAHRALDLPSGHHWHYEIIPDNLVEFSRPDGAIGEEWIYSLSAPPAFLADNCSTRDAARHLSSAVSGELPKVAWLKLADVLANGGFGAGVPSIFDKSETVRNDAFYAFVSHRWLDIRHPDPENAQARLLCCQLFASLLDAIRVAKLRGLNEPRSFSKFLGWTVGPTGSGLAESMIVNLLRPNIAATQLDRLADEISDLGHFEIGGGTEAAKSETALADIARALLARPVLRSLAERIEVWYDYSCIPQGGSGPAFEGVVDSALESLAGLQLLGCTVVMLDDPFDYLSRAWCTLEIGNADLLTGTYHLLAGSHRATAARGENEHHFEMLMEDRVHLIWRGVLDTIVFQTQDEEECMRRLGLAVTKHADLVKIFGRIRDLPAPRKIHTDHSELLTGTFPYPMPGGVRFLADAGRTSREMNARIADAPAVDFDLTSAMTPGSWQRRSRRSWRDYPSFDSFAGAATERRCCHLAIVGSCEGEAILWAAEVERRREEIQTAVGASVTSVSWMATDIAPVGTFAEARLSLAPISADVWVVTSLSARFDRCAATLRLLRAMLATGHETYLLEVDVAKGNLKKIPAGVATTTRNVGTAKVQSFAGGLFSAQLEDALKRIVDSAP